MSDTLSENSRLTVIFLRQHLLNFPRVIPLIAYEFRYLVVFLAYEGVSPAVADEYVLLVVSWFVGFPLQWRKTILGHFTLLLYRYLGPVSLLLFFTI